MEEGLPCRLDEINHGIFQIITEKSMKRGASLLKCSISSLLLKIETVEGVSGQCGIKRGNL